MNSLNPDELVSFKNYIRENFDLKYVKALSKRLNEQHKSNDDFAAIAQAFMHSSFTPDTQSRQFYKSLNITSKSLIGGL